ncbi:MAG TPA: response regulator transcription factor [Gemmatimonadaceae bacterium]|nr:response regulator transcription factor [Gemmatimonadaceae bacterium]
MSRHASLAAGRDAFERQSWSDAYARLSAADADERLDAPDLERLATAAYLLGKDAECADAWTRAHQAYAREGDVAGAARCAYWLAFTANYMGDVARSSGWIARGRRMLDEAAHDCPECGYLRIAGAIRTALAGDAEGSLAEFVEIRDIARRFGDKTLEAVGQIGVGRCYMHLGRAEEGLRLLDEALVSMTLGEVAPAMVGVCYCSALDACHETFDLRRAQEWTNAVTRWCESQPELSPYRGQCLVRRSEIMQLHGAWTDAMDEVRRACERLSHPPQRAVGHAFYQEAELHRVRGEFAAAEDAYRRATQVGRTPQPGLALLRLAQGNVDAAVVSIRGELAEARDDLRRLALLPAVVEITLAAGDLDTARACADELERNARVLATPLLRATAGQAAGAVLLAEGDTRAALGALRDARAIWGEIGAPYPAARVRALVGLAARALGDEDTATMELDAARRVFAQLGAATDLAAVERLLRSGAGADESELSTRELQVLRLIADGRTNRQIAQTLMISEKTVARHVSNIFLKLGVSTRTAATAYAYEHALL